MRIYYYITIALNIAAAFIIKHYVNISVFSLIPLLLIALTIFQARYFENEEVENGFRNVITLNLTADEENKMTDFASKALLIGVPLMIPFILFFPSSAKALSILIYLGSLTAGPLTYRIKNKGELQRRMETEKTELEEQKKREELGKWN